MASPEINELFEAFWELPAIPYEFPKYRSRKEIDYKYSLIRDFAKVHIKWDENENVLKYILSEPEMSPRIRELYKLISIGLQEMMSVAYVGNKKDEKVRDFLDSNVKAILAQLGERVTKNEYLTIMYYIFRDFIGLNKIEPLMRDPLIEDIECNGANTPVYIVHRFFESLKTTIVFDFDELVDFVEKLAQRCGRYISYAKPVLDGALPDGSRVNATYTSDVTTRGPTFTIRKFTRDPWTPTRLIAFGSASPEMYAYLWLAVEHKLNIMVIGETSSGKTTFLNSITFFIRPEARIVTIEDTRELNLPHENWLPAVQREGFSTGGHGTTYGEVTLFDLLKASFRQNPDYVIVGEVRGAEAYVLFQGMASGHPSMGTFHAGSVEMLLRRLESHPIDLAPALIQSLDIIVHTIRVLIGERSVRRIKSIYELIDVKEEIGKADYNIAYAWNPKEDSFSDLQSDYLLNRLDKITSKSKYELIQEIKLRKALLEKMVEKKIFNYIEFSKIVSRYYADPQGVLREFEINPSQIIK